MDAGEQLKIAGEAAGLLENQGFTAVARLRDGVVTLELWRLVRGKQLTLRHVIEGEATAEGLARGCAAMFLAAESSE